MGLDVYAVRVAHLVRAQPEHPDDDFWSEAELPGNIYLYDNPDFPGRAGGLVSGIYAGERLGSFDGPAHVGCSYSAHQHFRAWLCKRVLGLPLEEFWRDIKEGTRTDACAFGELLHFADNEGTLGVECCRKLLADFDAHADLELDDDLWVASHFARWRALLRIAVDAGGVLDFS